MTTNNNIDNFESKFKDLKEHVSFVAPDGYFDKLPNEIQQKLIEKKTEFNISFFSKHRILIPLSIAALSILIIAILIILPQLKNMKGIEKPLSEASITIIDEDILNEVDEHTLVDFISEQSEDTIKSLHKKKSYDLSEEKKILSTDTSANSVITDDDIMEYLLEEYGDDALKIT